MQVDNSNTSPAWTSQSSGVGTIQDRNSMAKDDFLKLLVTQLQNQDPMNPATNQEFAAQLAQFSQLEQLTEMNSTLEESLDANTQLADNIANSLATSYLGKDVYAIGDRLELGQEDGAMIRFHIDANSVDTSVGIFNEAGSLVRTLELGGRPMGGVDLVWDGTDSQGERLPAGQYRYQVEALDYEGEAVDTVGFMAGRITGIRYLDGTARLLMGEREVPLENVLDVIEPGA